LSGRRRDSLDGGGIIGIVLIMATLIRGQCFSPQFGPVERFAADARIRCFFLFGRWPMPGDFGGFKNCPRRGDTAG
jgi:hypothetical protein